MNRRLLSFLRVVCHGGLLQGLPPDIEVESASPYTVVSTLDNPDDSPGDTFCADSHGVCTLRAAVMEANAHVGPDTILVPAENFHLTIPGSQEDLAETGDLDLSGQVTLQGAGAGATIIDATGINDRVFQVLTSTLASLTGLTISGGIVPTSGLNAGGGLLNYGTLTLTQVTLSQNNLGAPHGFGGGIANWYLGVLTLNSSQVLTNGAALGGGIFNYGVIAIRGSRVASNTVTSDGGGAYNYGVLAISDSQVLSNTVSNNGGGVNSFAHPLVLTNALVSGNKAFLGGGLYSDEGRLTLSGSTVSHNQVTGPGGGLAVHEGPVTVANSTLTDNQAGGNGGGLIIFSAAPVSMTNSTLSGNSAGGDGGGVDLEESTLVLANVTLALNSANGNGGGVYQATGTFAGSFAAYNATIAENRANFDNLLGGSGGGIYLVSGSATLSNTLLADNWRASGIFGIADDCKGNFGAFRYSLVGTNSGCPFANDHTQVGANPQLLPLAANGGPTLTMALGPGSDALDAGDPAGCDKPGAGLLLTDQRGRPRHVDGSHNGLARCDMGAYEVQLELFLPLLRR